MPKEIQFLHKYKKMGNPPFRKARLLEVLTTHMAELHKEFIDYDTEFNLPLGYGTDFYKIPKMKVIVLLLLSEDRIWTTIRRFTPEKKSYYLSLRGHEFDIVITKKAKS